MRRTWTFFSFAAETICIARVIFLMLETERTLRLMARTERIAPIYPFFTTKPQRPQRGRAQTGLLLCDLCAFVVNMFLRLFGRKESLEFRDRVLERRLGLRLELLRLPDLLGHARML